VKNGDTIKGRAALQIIHQYNKELQYVGLTENILPKKYLRGNTINTLIVLWL